MNWKASIIYIFLLFAGLSVTFPSISPSPPLDRAQITKLSILWAFLVAVGIGVFKITNKKPDSN